MSPVPGLAENTARALSNFGRRREALLAAEAARADASDPFGSRALTALVVGGDRAAANAALRRCAEWFEWPALPGLNGHQGECDFTAIKLCRAHHLFAGGAVLEPETREKIRAFFLMRNFSSIYQSENHVFLFHTSRHLMGQAYPGETFAAYGKTGKRLCAEDGDWLRRFLRYRAGHGWGEFDSVCYLGPVWECLCCLFDFSEDATLRKTAGMMMNLLLADMAADSLRGMYCGAHGRIYPPHALDHATESTRVLQHLYLDTVGAPENGHHGFIIDALTSSWRPDPVVVDMALNPRSVGESRERKHLHNLADTLPVAPLPGSLRKYTYRTDHYALGCVQFQDAYPAACAHHAHSEVPVAPDQRGTAGYAHHQQHDWDLSFATRTDARLFTHHPGTDGTHNHWTGDRLCGCGHFFQHRQALAALYDIAETQPLRFIHAYVPRAAFDEVIEEDGWIFVRAGEVFAGLWLSSGYRWADGGEWTGREVVSDGLSHGVVCEAGTTEEHGGFAEFRSEIFANTIHFDRERMVLRYESKRAGILELDTRGGRRLDGRPANLDYATYDSPGMYSAWGSGVIELKSGALRRVLDFRED